MNSWLWWLGQNAITVSLLVPFVLLTCRRFRNRPAVQHMLWVVVLLKFLTPPLVTWPWTVEALREAIGALPEPAPGDGGVTILRTSALLDSGGNSDDPAWTHSPVRVEPINNRPIDRATSPESTDPQGAPPGAVWFGAVLRGVAGVWLLGAVLCAVRQLRRIARHATLVRHGTAAPERLRSEISLAASRLEMRPPRAVLVGGIRSPFMWCLGRLRLVWPAAMASDREVVRSRGVIAHELAHVRRGDHWVAWLELVAGVVWWWNPLFWFVRRRLRETAEMACDALAIGTNPESRRQYAEMLLELSAGFQSGAPAPVLAVRAGTPSSFERRLIMILSDRVSGKRSARGILAAVCLALVALPVWSPGQQEPPKAASPADDAALRELIEQGKFAEAKERLDALRRLGKGANPQPPTASAKPNPSGGAPSGMAMARAIPLTNAKKLPPPKNNDDYIVIFPLRGRSAEEISKTLPSLLPKAAQGAELVLVAEPTTNSLLVRGSEKDVATVKAVLSLWENRAAKTKPSPNEVPANDSRPEGNASGGEKKLSPQSTGGQGNKDPEEAIHQAVVSLARSRAKPSPNEVPANGSRSEGNASGGGQGNKDPEAVRKQLVKQAADLLASGKSSEEVVTTLYRAVLERKPTRPEVEYCVNYLATTANDREAAITVIVIVLQLEVVKASDSK
jgi:beta-lactamase regulating signal transducer with metallopeptidase domain